MKIVFSVVAILLLCAIGWGARAYYTHCGGFNSCVNPVCQVDCFVDGKRVK